MKIKTKIEYIWLDGTKPEQTLRSKTKIVELESTITTPTIEELPEWSFDGSSTQQATGSSSDCILRPVRVYPDPQRVGSYLALCEVLNEKGISHKTNERTELEDIYFQRHNEGWWFGFEQEYVLIKDGKPLGFPKEGFPEPQGKYYCGVGADRVIGREIVEQHLDACMNIGLDITGVNAEVMLGQWEYQLFGKGALKVSDDLWISRYLLYRITEQQGVTVELHPKPVEGDWNGSGMHVNFSTKQMRENGGKEMMEDICKALEIYHEDHINNYGSDNEKRLTGLHETQSIEKFSYGISDRGASIRIPVATVNNKWKGHLEDRRPGSNACPYKITKRILNTLKYELESVE